MAKPKTNLPTDNNLFSICLFYQFKADCQAGGDFSMGLFLFRLFFRFNKRLEEKQEEGEKGVISGVFQAQKPQHSHKSPVPVQF